MSDQKDSEVSKKFSKREWIHLIITLSIIQGVIWYVSLTHSTNTSALGYVSFAGTLISIILAVLAIGYTYGESQQQKNSSITLANQIESLVAIKDKLEIQAEALDNINVLKTSLDEFSKNVYGQLESTKKGFEDFVKDFGSSKRDDKNVESDKPSDFIATIFYAASPFNIMSLILLILFVENKDNKKRENNLFELYTFVNNQNIKELSEDEEYIIFGGMATWFQVLNRIGELSIEDSYVCPELIKIFNDYLNNPTEDFLESFEGGAKSLIGIAKASSYYVADIK